MTASLPAPPLPTPQLTLAGCTDDSSGDNNNLLLMSLSGGPSEQVKYTPAEEAVLNLIPDAAIQGVPGIPDPDEVALAEGSSVAGAVPAGQSLHVHFEETDTQTHQCLWRWLRCHSRQVGTLQPLKRTGNKC
ncbi:hypothetical protein Pcinc_006803 [Petrolisthes cinctipes]|uniref:Uncharacterized protein n=1 Tax=Petrolisthes cinctipes TaxID=88211 RepID=A0AAE1GGP2_PETCI|nr:hypothetical protein Pcinc_006803 [Petrolisthes cinctipes]